MKKSTIVKRLKAAAKRGVKKAKKKVRNNPCGCGSMCGCASCRKRRL